MTLSFTEMMGSRMRLGDLSIVGIYAIAMLAIGYYYRSKADSTDEYLLGGRTMNPWMIGLSLFATLTSTLSYFAYPGEIIQHGPMIFSQLIALPFSLLIVGWLLIPQIMKRHDVISAYELLEKRLGLTGRLLGATMFMLLRIVWMATILYATSKKVVVPMLGLDPSWSPLIQIGMGLVTIVYSAGGGMRAVVVTDAVQSFIMCAGAVVVIGFVTSSLGGLNQWWPDAWLTHWDEPVFWSADLRVSFAGAFMNMLVWMVCTAGADQLAIQRYLSTRDVKSARRSLAVQLLVEILMAALLACVGLAVLAFYRLRSPEKFEMVGWVQRADELFPHFVATELPNGLAGIIIAAILSAAMSSLSSGMNSASAVITTDFAERLIRTSWTESKRLRVAGMASIAIGLVAVVLSLFVGQLGTNLLELCVKVVNLLTAPLFVLFFLAIFVPWSNPAGAIAATLASVTAAVGVTFFHLGGLAFLWSGPVSLVVGIVVGTAASLCWRRAKVFPTDFEDMSRQQLNSR